MRSSSAARWPALAVAGSLVAAGALVTVKNGMVTDQLVGFGKQEPTAGAVGPLTAIES